MLRAFPTDILTRIADRLPFLTNNPIYRNANARVALFTLGAIVASFKVFKFVQGVLCPLFWFDRDLGGRYGRNSWAVITGATDGIGEAFVYELARRGFNMVLVGRNEEKLGKVVHELKQIHPSAQTRVVVADFVHSYEEGFAERMHEQVRGLDVSILINNAGTHDKSYYHEESLQKVHELVLTNALAQALITRVFLPDLAARTERSAIINISSMAASSPRPYVTIYSATKMFHDFLSRSLVYEHPNIDILSMKPGMVSTKMAGYRDIDLRTITREEFVQSALRALGRTSDSYGHWKHRLDGLVVDSCPRILNGLYFKHRYNMK